MDKAALVDQLTSQIRELARAAQSACEEAGAEARAGATASEKRADARVAIEYASLARGQKRRAEKAQHELRALSGFVPAAHRRGSAISVGDIVEVEDEESGQGRTFFLAPVGAGVTLSGPDGDGHLSVVTPASPIGKAVMGRRLGDVVDVTVKGVPRGVVHYLDRLKARAATLSGGSLPGKNLLRFGPEYLRFLRHLQLAA
jgi:transcription elongation GreA/GreB family factor